MCPAARPRPNPVWLLVVVAMVGLALAGPVVVVRDRLADRVAAPTAAEGAQPAAAPAGGAGGTGLAFAPGTLTVDRGATVVSTTTTPPRTRSRPAPAGSTRA
jgi:hypothetical protein